jgi:hypothetical protein
MYLIVAMIKGITGQKHFMLGNSIHIFTLIYELKLLIKSLAIRLPIITEGLIPLFSSVQAASPSNISMINDTKNYYNKRIG